jgi:sulfatase modifying factor 1
VMISIVFNAMNNNAKISPEYPSMKDGFMQNMSNHSRILLLGIIVGLISSAGRADLKVMLQPQEACDSGAKWRVDGGTWRSGGYIETSLSDGVHVVEYLNIENWKTPVSQPVQVNTDQTTMVTGLYFNVVDINSDNKVDLNDYYSLSKHWLQGNCAGSNGCDQTDINESGSVDIEDLFLLCERWLENLYHIPPDMVSIPAGTFQMGDLLYEGSSNEFPVHAVTLSSFYIGKYEITNGQYCLYLNSALQMGLITVVNNEVYQAGSGLNYAYCNIGSSYSQIHFTNNTFTVSTKGAREMSNDPVVMIDWYGAVAYCNWRSQQENRELCYNLSTWECDFSKKGYRLPTEAQWECAARGGLSGMRFPWGAKISHDNANYYSSDYIYDESLDRSYDPIWSADNIAPFTSPVGSFEANEFGIYDMIGNVQEWCQDWYDRNYYSDSPTNNPTGPMTGSNRVFRGGGWNNHGVNCRMSRREFTSPFGGSQSHGFRLVLECYQP